MPGYKTTTEKQNKKNSNVIPQWIKNLCHTLILL